jgi:DNA-binding XRE family transcriptional regulator
VSLLEAATVVDGLPRLLRARREQRGLTHAAMGRKLGVAGSTVWRFEQGGGCHSSLISKALRWLGEQERS